MDGTLPVAQTNIVRRCADLHEPCAAVGVSGAASQSRNTDLVERNAAHRDPLTALLCQRLRTIRHAPQPGLYRICAATYGTRFPASARLALVWSDHPFHRGERLWHMVLVGLSWFFCGAALTPLGGG